MSREECIKEMYQALTIGGVITMLIFAFTHQIFGGAGEVIAFMASTYFVATFASWTVLDIFDRRRANGH